MKNAAFSAFILIRQAMLRLRLMYLFMHYSTEVRRAVVLQSIEIEKFTTTKMWDL